MTRSPGKKATEWVETKATDEWLWVSNLHGDSRYQRPIAKRKVRKIAAEFDPDALGSIYVSERDDGTFVVLDGHHRVVAVRDELGWTDQKVPCHVYHGLSLEDEARLFRKFNELRTRPRPIDLYRAKVVEGDPAALDIEKLLKSRGLVVNTGLAPNTVQAVQALERIYTNGGKVVLGRALDVAARAWGARGDAYQGDVLTGIALVCSRFPTANLDRLVKKLAAHEPGVLLSRARLLRESEASAGVSGSDGRVASATARVIVGLYNAGARAGRLAWESDRIGKALWRPSKSE